MQDNNELRNLILHPYESKEHEFKGPMKWDGDDKKACCELVKDILAMANAKGGFIIIGVEETKSGFNPKGLTQEQVASFETSELNRFVQRYAEPPINTNLAKIEDNGKSFVIIKIPQFSNIPHICKKDYPGVLTTPTLYIRTDNNESAPISNSNDFHGLIESAIRKREQSLLTSIRSIFKGYEPNPAQMQTIEEQYEKQIVTAIKAFEDNNPLGRKNYRGYREVVFFPSYLYEEKRFAVEKLKDALKQSSVNFKGWPFIFVSSDTKDLYVIQDGIESLIEFPDFKGNDRIDFWRIYTSGLFYYKTLMWEESQERKPDIINGVSVPVRKYGCPTMDFIALTLYVAEAINSLTLLYTALDVNDEPITARFRILGTNNRLLTTYHPGRDLDMNYISKIPEIVEERTYSLTEWKAGIIDLSVDVIKSICLKFNWDNPSVPVFKKDIEKLFSRTF